MVLSQVENLGDDVRATPAHESFFETGFILFKRANEALLPACERTSEVNKEGPLNLCQLASIGIDLWRESVKWKLHQIEGEYNRVSLSLVY